MDQLSKNVGKNDKNFLTSRANSIRETAKRSVEGIVFIGKWLTECKQRLPHGQWLPWLKAEFGWSRQTAVSFMQVYELAKCQDFGHLPIDVSALKLIAAPSTPEPIRQEVIRRAQTGERITHAAVMELEYFPTAVVEQIINRTEKQKQPSNIHTLKQELAREINKILRPDDPLVKRLDEVIAYKDDFADQGKDLTKSALSKNLECIIWRGFLNTWSCGYTRLYEGERLDEGPWPAAWIQVYRHEIDEPAKRLKLWVRRKRGNKQLVCSGCGQLVGAIAETYEREVRDLPCFEYLTTVVIELYRLRCSNCGLKSEKVPLLPSKAPFSKRFEDAVGLACESAAARRVAQQFGLSASTVRAIDLRYLERWSQSRRKPALRKMGVDEIYLGKKQEVLHRGKQS